jgi:hypothetical protein
LEDENVTLDLIFHNTLGQLTYHSNHPIVLDRPKLK